MIPISHIGGAIIVLLWLFKIIHNHNKKNAKSDKCSDNELPFCKPESNKKLNKKL